MDFGYEYVGFFINLDVEICGFIYIFSDDIIGLCGDNFNNFVIVWEWLFLSSCGFEIYMQDVNGNDNVQVIMVEDRILFEIEVSVFIVGVNILQ